MQEWPEGGGLMQVIWDGVHALSPMLFFLSGVNCAVLEQARAGFVNRHTLACC